MFPLQRSCELSFQISNPQEDDRYHHHRHHHQQPLQIIQQEQDGIIVSGNHPSASADNDNVSTRKKSQQRTKSVGDHTEFNRDDVDEEEDVNNSKKRIIHREIERQRRQHMSKLVSSLWALLPPEYNKGKRPISDHIMEAANYVKNLQKSIKQLERKRDGLKRTSDSVEFSQCQVAVHACSGGGVEVKISVRVGEENCLSRFLNALLEEGLDVVSCVSTKANEKWLHIIHAQVDNSSCIDPSWLQQRVTSKVCPYVSLSI